MHLYTVHHNETRLGPLSGEELLARHRAGEIPAGALVWRPGLAAWGELATVLSADGLLPPPVSGVTPPSLRGGDAGAQGTPPPRPKSWLAPAIVSTLCCCLPFGIAGIVFAAQVDGKYRAGDYAGAEKAAKNARLWTILGASIGLLGSVVYVGLMAATAIPAFTKVRNNAIEKTLINDARRISSAANQVMAEAAKTSATVGEIRQYVSPLSPGVTLVIGGKAAGNLSEGASDTVVLRQTGRFSLRHLNYHRQLSSQAAIAARSGPPDEIEFEVAAGTVAR